MGVQTRSIHLERKVGRRGGGRTWPIWIVQLICEMLTHGAPPHQQFRGSFKQ